MTAYQSYDVRTVGLAAGAGRSWKETKWSRRTVKGKSIRKHSLTRFDLPPVPNIMALDMGKILGLPETSQTGQCPSCSGKMTVTTSGGKAAAACSGTCDEENVRKNLRLALYAASHPYINVDDLIASPARQETQ